MLERLTNPFKRRFRKYAGLVRGFVVPIRDVVVALMEGSPLMRAASSKVKESNVAKTAKGFWGRLKAFRQSLKGMGDFQKLVLLTIAVVLPAGILLAVVLIKFIRRGKKR